MTCGNRRLANDRALHIELHHERVVLERDEHVIAMRPHEAHAMRTEVDEDARERGENRGLEYRDSAELEGKRQHELTHGDIWKNPIHKTGRAICHAPARTARANSAQLARVRDEQMVTA